MMNLKDTQLLRLATYLSVCAALLMICIKLYAWTVTGSVTILASLIDSMMDSLVSIVNLLAMRYALMPADDEHRFGHGKAEPIAGLGQAAFIAGSALFLILHSIERLRFPKPLEQVDTGIAVMVITIVITSLLLAFQHYVVRRTASTLIRADSLHYASDLLANIAIIIALLLAQFDLPWLDPVFALGIAIYILYTTHRIGRDALQQLLDRELPEAVQQQIINLALQHTDVRGVHDLRTRKAGHTLFIQLHLELDGQLLLTHAHKIAEDVERAINAEFPNAQIILHEDPAELTQAHRQ